jgi:hypothetical protein
MARIVAIALALMFCVVSLGAATADPMAGIDMRNFSGVWMNDNTLDERLKREGRKRLTPAEAAQIPQRGAPPLTPEYQRKYDENQAARAKLEVGAEACEWPGMPRIMTYPYPLEILHTPGRITMIFEAESQVRRIFLDRREHLPADELDPSYNGDSIGWWEGNTLVVDTIGFNTRTHVGSDLPHSEDMHITERVRYVDADTIQVDMTIEDPRAFARPIQQKIIYSKRPDWRIREYSCLENNRDAPNAAGQRSAGVVDEPLR